MNEPPRRYLARQRRLGTCQRLRINIKVSVHDIRANPIEYLFCVRWSISLLAMISLIIVDVYTDVIGRNTEMAVVASENVNQLRKYMTNIRIIIEKWPIRTIDDTIYFRIYCFILVALHFLWL
jgi:hypothetical protein